MSRFCQGFLKVPWDVAQRPLKGQRCRIIGLTDNTVTQQENAKDGHIEFNVTQLIGALAIYKTGVWILKNPGQVAKRVSSHLPVPFLLFSPLSDFECREVKVGRKPSGWMTSNLLLPVPRRYWQVLPGLPQGPKFPSKPNSYLLKRREISHFQISR